ncbi:hypothetical protein ETU09_02765 [Apibacter muscae]|uniref:Uncharacterized protein n=1 Tax=Apibacter muscae TaxID=2509004 RepID=A0A563DIT4_9FLAO|nr:hypothetical protein [Apibacter muscae]TWP29921.1 hypothetical protein ETU09_02765 [Apibacter muscae]
MKRKEIDLLENSKDYFTSLSKMDIESYRQLGFTLHSILRVCQSAILAKEYNIHLHTDLDIYNLLSLMEKLIPDSELEFLDEVYSLSD